uniref:Uncharacterized protein n=1 Tax=Setaria viridis TaxID=4556 RepID=A0A4U6U8X5_SETVI|nr:hypothetical protein SEVIR_6G208366v2 [Setaria viridis]
MDSYLLLLLLSSLQPTMKYTYSPDYDWSFLKIE